MLRIDKSTTKEVDDPGTCHSTDTSQLWIELRIINPRNY